MRQSNPSLSLEVPVIRIILFCVLQCLKDGKEPRLVSESPPLPLVASKADSCVRVATTVLSLGTNCRESPAFAVIQPAGRPLLLFFSDYFTNPMYVRILHSRTPKVPKSKTEVFPPFFFLGNRGSFSFFNFKKEKPTSCGGMSMTDVLRSTLV